MSQNPKPRTVSEMLSLGGHVANGIHDLGAGLGLLQYTDANFPPLVSGLQTLQNTYNQKRSGLTAAYVPWHAALGEIRRACLTARKILSISLGDDYSDAWIAPGWTDDTTAVPTDVPSLTTLAEALETFLTDNPTYEVSAPKVTFTAANFGALLANFATNEQVLTAARAAMNDAGTARNGANDTLGDAIRGVVQFLEKKLDPNDPRWDQFGLNRPGASNTPAQATIASLVKSGSGAALATADVQPEVTYYRWKYKLVGIDTAFRFWGRTNDPMVLITGLPATGTLQVTCEAANHAGPGKASAIKTLELS